MPIVPERVRVRQEVRAALGSQFWGQEAASPRSIDGKCPLLPCEPVPLSLTAPSGLSRTQQLLAAQALGLPALPSYVGDSGGLVLDRVLAKIGGKAWWVTLGSRMHAQRALLAGASLEGSAKLRPLRDPLNYASCTRLHLQLARILTLNALLESRDLRPLRRRLDRLVRGEEGSPPRDPDQALGSGRGSLRLALPGHELVASLAADQEVVDASGTTVTIPFTTSLDFSSAMDRGDGMQYRIGLHQTCAPAEGDGSGPMQTRQHVQGAVAVEGEALLWRAGSKPKKPRAGEVHGERAGDGAAAGVARTGAAVALGGAPPVTQAAAGHAGPAGPQAGLPPERKQSADADQAVAGPGEAADEADAAALERHIVPMPGEGAGPGVQEDASQPVPRTPLTAVNARVLSALGTLRRVQASLAQARAEGGRGWDLDGLVPGGRRRSAPSVPYSLVTPGPHLKLNGAIGCLGRVPLPAGVTLPLGWGTPPPAPAPLALSPRRPSWQASSASLASQRGADAWEPYLRNTSLRVFLSTGISGQLGRFRRRFLDFTAAALRVDVGLTSQHVLGALPSAEPVRVTPPSGAWNPTGLPGPGPDRHPAFALEGRGTWHALSASATQQVWGPLRARCDLRFALDPTYVPADEGERSTVHGLVATALSVRASRLETVLGADCVVPGSGGGARLVLWYSLQRREGMAEIHLL